MLAPSQVTRDDSQSVNHILLLTTECLKYFASELELFIQVDKRTGVTDVTSFFMTIEQQ